MGDAKLKGVVFVDKNDDLKTVLSCFCLNKISHIPVLNEKTVIGMVSKTDVVEFLHRILPERMGEAFGSLCESVKVKELMIQPIIEAQVEESHMSILEKLLNHQVSSVVLKKGDQIVGIVTEKDMVRYLSGTYEKGLSFSEKLGMHLVDWLDKNGIIKISRVLADIGI